MNTSLNVNQGQFGYWLPVAAPSPRPYRPTGPTPNFSDAYECSAPMGRWGDYHHNTYQSCGCQGYQMMGGSPFAQMQQMQMFMQMFMMGGMDPGSALFMLGLMTGGQQPMQGHYPQFPQPWGPPQPPPPQHSGLAERYQPGATVAVFDNFRDTANRTTHGEQVENVMMQQGLSDQDIQRFHNAEEGTSLRPLADAQNPRQFHNALNSCIENSFTGLLNATSNNMEQILDDPNSQVRVINQSQSMSSADVTHHLLSVAGQDPQVRSRLIQELGLPEDCSKQQFVQALANRVRNVEQNSPRVRAEKERYQALSEEAADRGINHVVAAGNNGEEATALRRLGVEVPPDYFTSVLENEHTTSVGALNRNGTGPTSFSAPNAEIAARGQDVLTTADGKVDHVNGTSFSAPQVAARMALMRRQNPYLSAQETEDILKDTASPVAGDPSQAGAGQMNPDLALCTAARS